MEKYRNTWKVKDWDLEVTIDSLPFADFMEVEGGEEEIDKFLEKLGLKERERITVAYWRVYEKYCEEKGLKEKKDLTFQENK